MLDANRRGARVEAHMMVPNFASGRDGIWDHGSPTYYKGKWVLRVAKRQRSLRRAGMQVIDPIEAVGLGQRKKSGEVDWRKNGQGMEWNRKA